MQRFMLVFVFAFCLFLKVVNAAGADAELSGDSQTTSNAEMDADVSSVLTAKSNKKTTNSSVTLSPMIGGTSFTGNWNDHISNAYSLGLAVEMPIDAFGVELEGGYGKYRIAYNNFSHNFNQYTIALNGKYYLTRGTFQPYVGLGIAAINYEGLSPGPFINRSQWMGAPQAMAGADISLSEQVALGVRGAWVVPLINRPGVPGGNGALAPLYYEEASAMNTSFLRLMGTAKLSF